MRRGLADVDHGLAARCRAVTRSEGRLLLGMKGTMSEMELSLFRQRSLEALKRRRARRALPHRRGRLPQGAPRPHREGPDRRVQEAIALVFFQVRRAADGSAGSPLDAPRAPAPPGGRLRPGGAQHHLEAARLQRPPPHPDQPDTPAPCDLSCQMPITWGLAAEGPRRKECFTEETPFSGSGTGTPLRTLQHLLTRPWARRHR